MDLPQEFTAAQAMEILGRILKDWRIFLADQQARRQEHLELIKLFNNQREVINGLTVRVSEVLKKNAALVRENMELRKQLNDQEEDYRRRLRRPESKDVAVQVSSLDFYSFSPLPVVESSIPSDSSSLSDNCSVSSRLNDFDPSKSPLALTTPAANLPVSSTDSTASPTTPKPRRRSQKQKAPSRRKQEDKPKVVRKQPLKPVNAAVRVGRSRKKSTKASELSSSPEVTSKTNDGLESSSAIGCSHDLLGKADDEEMDLEVEKILGEFRRISDQLGAGPMSPLSPITMSNDEDL